MAFALPVARRVLRDLSMREKGLERSTQRLTVTVLGNLFGWLVDGKQLSQNPVRQLSRARRKQLATGERTKAKVPAGSSRSLSSSGVRSCRSTRERER